eukprot:3880033-Amphidinium_carterae.1
MTKPFGTDARDSPLAVTRLQPWGRMVAPPLWRWFACGTNCQAPTMTTSAGSCWNPRSVLKLLKARGFASELEEWSFCMGMAKRFEEAN